MDYGFYLLNVDAAKKSVHAYKLALAVNIHLNKVHVM